MIPPTARQGIRISSTTADFEARPPLRHRVIKRQRVAGARMRPRDVRDHPVDPAPHPRRVSLQHSCIVPDPVLANAPAHVPEGPDRARLDGAGIHPPPNAERVKIMRALVKQDPPPTPGAGTGERRRHQRTHTQPTLIVRSAPPL
jgi:hypothetical protein